MPATHRPPIDIEPRHWAIVSDILCRHLPDTEVRAFGSRVTGRTKPYSDLDLLIMPRTPISLRHLGLLQEAFSESELPWKVDLVDGSTISDTFRLAIVPQSIRIHPPEQTPDPVAQSLENPSPASLNEGAPGQDNPESPASPTRPPHRPASPPRPPPPQSRHS